MELQNPKLLHGSVAISSLFSVVFGGTLVFCMKLPFSVVSDNVTLSWYVSLLRTSVDIPLCGRTVDSGSEKVVSFTPDNDAANGIK